MKISDLIKTLEQIKYSLGDLEVKYFPYDWTKLEDLDEISTTKLNGEIVLVIGDD